MKSHSTVRLIPIMLLGLCSMLFLSLSARAQSTLFELDSVEGDYVGQGKTIQNTNTAAVHLTGSQGTINVMLGSGSGYRVQFKAATGTRLAVGTYTNADRMSSDGLSPGLDISGDGRGCNKSCGSFQIREIHSNSNGDVDRFWVTFTNSCECTMPPLTGEIRFNSKLAPAKPLSEQ